MRFMSTTIEDLSESHVASRSTLIRIAAVGVAADVAFAGRAPGISIPVFFAVSVMALRTLTRRSWQDDVLLAAAVVTVSFCVVRASAPLIAIDVMAALAMIAVAVASGPNTIMRATFMEACRVWERVLRATAQAFPFVLRPVARSTARIEIGRVRPVLRALAIAIPLMVLMGALLASADRVFAELIVPSAVSFDLSGVVRHLGWIIAGCFAAAVAVRASLTREAPCHVDQFAPTAPPRLQFAEWATVLAGIDALFVMFVGVQLAVLFGGHRRVEVTPGLTYAEYARSGFFQLIAVGVLTVGIVALAWMFGAREGRRARISFAVLVGVMTSCSFVILISAWIRLRLYEDAFGFTVDRLLAAVCIVFIGFVFVALIVAIALQARHRFLSIVMLGAICSLLALNLIDPERMVAQHNAQRFAAIRKVDVFYLGGMGPDAVPTAVALLPELDRARRAQLRYLLCRRSIELGATDPDVRSTNVARNAARRSLTNAGLTPRVCERLTYPADTSL
jgi:hypothetical protein